MIDVYASHMMSEAAYSEHRVVNPEECAGISELAEYFGLTKSAVSNWPARHPDFPKPVRIFAMGPMYVLAEVEEWYNQTVGTFQKLSQAA